MTIAFDEHAINHMIVSINREMTPLGKERHADADTIFIGGPMLSDGDQDALAKFGLTKNFKIVFLSFDPTKPVAGPIAIHAVVTDGLTQSTVLQRGRLWKKDRRTAAILLFPEAQIAVRLSTKGQLLVGPMANKYHDHGYDLALETIVAVADRKPGKLPVVSSIGSMVTVLDIKTVQHAFENAE